VYSFDLTKDHNLGHQDYEAFIQDLDNAKLDEQIINDNKDIHTTYETFESSFLDVVNKHNIF
jgi:hypothetical protein